MFQKYCKYCIFLFFIGACVPDSEQFSEIPFIKFESIEQIKLNNKDSLIRFKISYTDGDGNIGLEVQDTQPPFDFYSKYFHNLYIEYYAINNGVASKLIAPSTTDTIQYNDRIKNLTPTGKNKSIKGVLEMDIPAIPYPGLEPDSVYFTFQLLDRNLNKSNKLITNVLNILH